MSDAIHKIVPNKINTKNKLIQFSPTRHDYILKVNRDHRKYILNFMLFFKFFIHHFRLSKFALLNHRLISQFISFVSTI